MQHARRAPTTHGLTELPEGSELRSVTAVPTDVSGRRALRVELTDAVTLQGALVCSSISVARPSSPTSG
jgi:hypothetical protein